MAAYKGSGAGASLASTNPADIGATAVGVGTTAARADHVHTLPANGVTTTMVTDANITRAKLSNGTALSVIGRGANSSGVTADIAATAASDGVMRENGSTIGFGTIATAGIANGAVTVGKMANLAGLSVLGVTGTSSATPAAITGTASQVLQVNSGGTGLVFAAPAAAVVDIAGATQATDFKVLTDSHLLYDASAAANRRFVGYDLITARNLLHIYTDCFLDNGSSGRLSGEFAPYGSKSGVPSVAAHPGILQLSSTGTASGIWNGESFGAGLLLGGGKWRFATSLKTPASISDGTTRYEIYAGFLDCGTSGSSAATSNGVYISYTDNVNGGKFQLNCKAASTLTSVDLGTVVAINTWYTLEFEVNAAGTSVQGYVDRASAGTAITTNIPTAGWDVNVGIKDTTGTGSRALGIDYIQVVCELTAPR